MNKLVMNYLVTEGFKEAAERFQDEAGLSAGQDLGLMDDRIRIRDNIQVATTSDCALYCVAVQAGRIEEAISLVNQLHPQLLDNDRCSQALRPRNSLQTSAGTFCSTCSSSTSSSSSGPARWDLALLLSCIFCCIALECR